MKRILFAALIAGGMLGVARPARAQATEPFLGQIMIFSGNFCPTGWIATNGAILEINTHSALFAVVGTTYGGNGTTNFAVPHMAPIDTQTHAALTTCIAIQGVFPSRN